MFDIEDDNDLGPFNAGDKVKCIDDCPGTILVKGVYTIDFVEQLGMHQFLHLVEIKGGWLSDRFIKI